METLDPNIGHLSNREVLDLLLEEQKTQAEAIAELKATRKRQEAQYGTEKERNKYLPAWDERKEVSRLLLPENVRSVQIQAIEFLEDPEFNVVRQSSQGVVDLTRALGRFEPRLTKLEKLQLVNMAPEHEPELTVMIDDMDNKIGTRVEEMLQLIQSHLQERAVLPEDGDENKADVGKEAAILAAKSRKEALENEEAQLEQEYQMEDEDMEEDDLVGAGKGPKTIDPSVELDEATNE